MHPITVITIFPLNTVNVSLSSFLLITFPDFARLPGLLLLLAVELLVVPRGVRAPHLRGRGGRGNGRGRAAGARDGIGPENGHCTVRH